MLAALSQMSNISQKPLQLSWFLQPDNVRQFLIHCFCARSSASVPFFTSLVRLWPRARSFARLRLKCRLSSTHETQRKHKGDAPRGDAPEEGSSWIYTPQKCVCWSSKQLKHVWRGRWKGDCWHADRGFFIRHVKRGCWRLLIAKRGLYQRCCLVKMSLVPPVLPLAVNVDCVFSPDVPRETPLWSRGHTAKVQNKGVQSPHFQMFFFRHD